MWVMAALGCQPLEINRMAFYGLPPTPTFLRETMQNYATQSKVAIFGKCLDGTCTRMVFWPACTSRTDQSPGSTRSVINVRGTVINVPLLGLGLMVSLASSESIKLIGRSFAYGRVSITGYGEDQGEPVIILLKAPVEGDAQVERLTTTDDQVSTGRPLHQLVVVGSVGPAVLAGQQVNRLHLKRFSVCYHQMNDNRQHFRRYIKLFILKIQLEFPELLSKDVSDIELIESAFEMFPARYS